ncbi:DnaJ like subfamily C member 28, partial [Pseudolycoriella hygida]
LRRVFQLIQSIKANKLINGDPSTKTSTAATPHVRDCQSVKCAKVLMCPKSRISVIPPGECCAQCQPDCIAINCGTLFCSDGYKKFQSSDECCPSCQRDCSAVQCLQIVCPTGSEAKIAPGECCAECQPILSTNCDLVRCAPPECSKGQIVVTAPGSCCAECVFNKPIVCPTLCKILDCPKGQVSKTPPGECCPVCKPIGSLNCDAVLCAAPDCPKGQRLVTPTNECCPVCQPIESVDCSAKMHLINNLILKFGIKVNQFEIIIVNCRRYVTTISQLYEKCYEILKVSPDADQNTVRQAYITLVKKVHPDSGHKEANSERFAEVDNAFRILQGKYAQERRGIYVKDTPEVKEFDIKHTAPQHRQFLSYDGVGYGSPAQREKQYQQTRASRAYGKVFEYRIDKVSASDSALMKPGVSNKNHAIKTKYGFDRVVEDLIQEAMSKGDFDNLRGIGKPLSDNQSQNPYVDFTQHKINKILLDNGFTPEWITLQKEINMDINELKKILMDRRSYFTELPLHESEATKWKTFIESQENRTAEINRKIDKYNLLVPILDKQMCQVQLNKISESVLNTKPNVAERSSSKCAVLRFWDAQQVENPSSRPVNAALYANQIVMLSDVNS